MKKKTMKKKTKKKAGPSKKSPAQRSVSKKVTNPLLHYLEKYKITQCDFAESVGMSFMKLSRLIHGRQTNIKVDLLKALHQRTDIPYSKLINFLTNDT